VTVVVVSSLGKAFGVPGGVVLGPTRFVGDLKRNPFFTAGSAVPPAYLYAFVRAQSLYQQAGQQLFANVAYFQQQTEALGLFRSLDQYPVFYTADNALAAAVAPQCVLSSFPYPHPDSALITRVIVSSLHTRADLDTLEKLIREYIQ
jgi:7-keto-8-aminopelargonate synthetase-like enzyme